MELFKKIYIFNGVKNKYTFNGVRFIPTFPYIPRGFSTFHNSHKRYENKSQMHQMQ